MRGIEFDDFIGRIGLDAVAGGEHQVARNRRARAEGAVRADDHHRVATVDQRRGRIASDGERGRTEQRQGEGGEGRAHARDQPWR